METQQVGTQGFSPSALAAQAAQGAQAARATAGSVGNVSRDDFQARAEQTDTAQGARPAQDARPTQDARPDQLRTERDQEAVRAASSARREMEDNTYTASASVARFGGGQQAAGSVVDLRA
jgi:hypothetical protein